MLDVFILCPLYHNKLRSKGTLWLNYLYLLFNPSVHLALRNKFVIEMPSVFKFVVILEERYLRFFIIILKILALQPHIVGVLCCAVGITNNNHTNKWTKFTWCHSAIWHRYAADIVFGMFEMWCIGVPHCSNRCHNMHYWCHYYNMCSFDDPHVLCVVPCQYNRRKGLMCPTWMTHAPC